MSCRNSKERYGCITKFLHGWLAVLMTIQIVLGIVMGYLDKGAFKGQVYTFHKSLGILILLSAIIFLLWNLINPKPAWPLSMGNVQRVVAKMVHFLLYILALAMPLSGWMMSTASGHDPNVFWLFVWPMPGVAHSKALASFASATHSILAWTVLALIIIHALAACYHHFIVKDHILRRIL